MPISIHLACPFTNFIDAEPGQKQFPKSQLCTGTMDKEQTAQSFTVPELGDTGNLVFRPEAQTYATHPSNLPWKMGERQRKAPNPGFKLPNINRWCLIRIFIRKKSGSPVTLQSARMQIHLLTIGDELLIGQITDTNSAWMSRELNLAGMAVTGKSTVGDNPADIWNAVVAASSRAEVVITTGGLGPTKDDVTKKVLADLFDSNMEFHPETYDRIAGYFTRINKEIPSAMQDQATLPTKARLLPNKVGTAPGMWFESEGKIVISLPGVPFEMEYLMTHEVIPALQKKFNAGQIVHYTLRTACEGESSIAEKIADFENKLPEHIKLAYLPALGEVRLRLSSQIDNTNINANTITNELKELTSSLKNLLGEIVYGEENQSLASVVGALLQKNNLSIGTAESCTGGYVAHLLTSTPGCSNYYQGSVVSYAYEMKENLLAVNRKTLETHGAVSEETVGEMAKGALSTLQTSITLAISGIAGPDGGTPDKPVGTVWVAIANQQFMETHKFLFGRDRLKNIHLTGIYALNAVRKFLLKYYP
jgi:nicotinamide-nucleotide amidase